MVILQHTPYHIHNQIKQIVKGGHSTNGVPHSFGAIHSSGLFGMGATCMCFLFRLCGNWVVFVLEVDRRRGWRVSDLKVKCDGWSHSSLRTCNQQYHPIQMHRFHTRMVIIHSITKPIRYTPHTQEHTQLHTTHHASHPNWQFPR